MNYTIQELAMQYAEAMIAQRRTVVALTEAEGATEEQLRQLREFDYDAWAAMCEAQQKLAEAVNRYVDNEYVPVYS